MQPSEIRDLAEGEFETRLRELEEELFGLRVRRATGQLENPMKVREVKRELARFLTIQRERERARAGAA